jgi:seryl-tRNA synthetase
MLDLREVTERLDETAAQLRRRGHGATDGLDQLGETASARKRVIARLEALRAERNAANAAMARLDKQTPEFDEKRTVLRALGEESKALEGQQRQLEAALDTVLLSLPNVPHSSAPDGVSSEDNPVVRTWGDKPSFDFDVRDHVDIAQALGIVDFERAGKLSGARFAILKGQGAQLERALYTFMLDMHVREHGYTEIWPPVLVRETALLGTGQLPKFAEDVFRIEQRPAPGQEPQPDLYLIPTAEVPLTNMHAGEILDAAELPIAYTAYTPCFRSEAGSYGKDTRGLIRQHQFDKVELVRIVKPADGLRELELLSNHAERVLQALGLHHRVVELCTGDLGFASQKTYDLEVWLPAQNAYREISSCSWCGDFQARRAGIRFREQQGQKPQLAHTLNGSGLAVGRTLVAILEQRQQADGSVLLPSALVPYMGAERLRPR